MKLRIILVFGCLGAIVLSGCQAIESALERKQQVGAVVEVNGHYLYRSTIDSLTLGLNREDSLRVAQQFIGQWAKDILLYDAAKVYATPEIERLVDDYRRSLYVHAYEEHLVEKRMSKVIMDSTIEQLYLKMPDRFRLDESIVHGILVVIPSDAPKSNKLRQWLGQMKGNDSIPPELMDNIEKYAYQNASGYELFTDRWLTTSDLMNIIPIERSDLENRIKQKDQIEIKDLEKTFLLQLTAKHLRGQAMPLEYARPEIEKMILSARQVEFLRHERERQYDEAIQNNKIKFFN